MNRILKFKMAIRAGLIITLLLAVVMAAGCRKKQDNASAPAASDKKSPEQDTQIATPVVEANGPGAVTLPTESAVDNKETTADKTAPEAADAKTAVQQKAPSSSQLKASPIPEPADLKHLESLKSAEEKIDFITKFAAAHPESMPALVYKALDDNNVKVRIVAIEMLAMKGSSDPNVVYVAAKAMKDSESRIRQSAVRACTFVTDPAVGSVLVSALADDSEEVRTAAIEVADRKEPAIRLSVLKVAIASQFEDVKETALSSLTDIASPAAMDILITGLKDVNPDFRDEVKSAITSLVSQDFDTYDQAQKWWDANRNKFDNELKEKN
jgi:hypothetical protein